MPLHYGRQIVAIEGCDLTTLESVDIDTRDIYCLARGSYALALFNIVTDTSNVDIGQKIDALEALDSLSHSDLDVLAKFSAAYPIRVADLLPPMYMLPNAAEDSLSELVAPLVQSLAKLESRALISETVPGPGGYSWSGDANHWVNRWRRKAYTILPFGRNLLKYLEEP